MAKTGTEELKEKIEKCENIFKKRWCKRKGIMEGECIDLDILKAELKGWEDAKEKFGKLVDEVIMVETPFKDYSIYEQRNILKQKIKEM